jgi:hypothetical protein
MKLSKEVKQKIKQFSEEQAQLYLDEAELTYMEKIRRKTGRAKKELIKNLSKFKARSDSSIEAQNDMIVYMSDYINDLIDQGYSEQDAFERARADFEFRSESDQSTDLQKQFEEYYRNYDPAAYEAMGLFYAGFTFLGLSVGLLVGFLGGGGLEMFLHSGWKETLIGGIVGGAIGSGLGLISHGFIALKKDDLRKRFHD